MILTKKKKILLIFIVVVIFAIVIIKFILNRNRQFYSHNLNEYTIIHKKYGVNEYSPVNISDEQLANIYLNDFKYYLFNDIEYAYNLLEDSYRSIKFGNIENFKKYVDSINYSKLVVNEYRISNSKNFIEVHTLNDEKYIFKINGVLDYIVYLDDHTVEISLE